VDVVEAFRLQARWCWDLGSPMYAALLGRVADDLARGGGVAGEVLRGHEDDPGPSALALRLLGGVHREVLAGRAADLARFYPSVGGTWRLEEAWPHFTRTLTDCRDEIVRLLDVPPQTNEVGRAAALMGGLLHIATDELPIRLFEIGSSGGLNLRPDYFRYVRADGTGWGPPDSPVVLDPAWQGRALPGSVPRIVERLGSDPAPADVTTDAGRLALLSYVWPDQLARFGRLRGAFEVADRVPVDVRVADAATMLRSVELEDGATTVLWHSVMWQYLGADEKRSALERIGDLGAAASGSRRFAHLSLEQQRRAPEADREFLVVLQTWPRGERRVLGTAAPHGVPAVWE
jgi:hypothetical protein